MWHYRVSCLIPLAWHSSVAAYFEGNVIQNRFDACKVYQSSIKQPVEKDSPFVTVLYTNYQCLIT